jgi:hypothetical protein
MARDRPIVGLDRTVGFAPKISGTMKELSGDAPDRPPTSRARPRPSGGGVTTITPKKAGILLVAGEYLSSCGSRFRADPVDTPG